MVGPTDLLDLLAILDFTTSINDIIMFFMDVFSSYTSRRRYGHQVCILEQQGGDW